MPRKKKEKIETIADTTPTFPKEERMKFVTKADVMPPIAVDQKPWTPAPDMGAIKAPTPGDKKCSTCNDMGKMHYGGKSNWCNVQGCNCQAFKE